MDSFKTNTYVDLVSCVAMRGQIPVRLFQTVSVTFMLFLAGLACSPAIGEQSNQSEIVISCTLKSTEGEKVEVILTEKEGELNLNVNDLDLIGVVPLRGHSHSPTIAVASNMDDRGVYTLAIHRAFFRPFPLGFDPNNPRPR